MISSPSVRGAGGRVLSILPLCGINTRIKASTGRVTHNEAADCRVEPSDDACKDNSQEARDGTTTRKKT